MKNGMRPVHPGEILREEFLKPLGMSASALAQVIRVPANRVSEIVAEKRAVTADTALRLAKAFGSGPEVWLNLQKTYELRVAETNREPRSAPFGASCLRRTRLPARGGDLASTLARVRLLLFVRLAHLGDGGGGRRGRRQGSSLHESGLDWRWYFVKYPVMREGRSGIHSGADGSDPPTWTIASSHANCTS